MKVELIVNGVAVDRDVPERMTLADLLRGPLGLTGTHLGCEQGACGACTVLLDGEPTRSCLLFAVQAGGATVTTIEGLAPGGAETVPVLHPVQEAFVENRALQCGFCTPGLVLSLAHALEAGEPVHLSELEDLVAGHICRCTGYQPIMSAAQEVLRAQDLLVEDDR